MLGYELCGPFEESPHVQLNDGGIANRQGYRRSRRDRLGTGYLRDLRQERPRKRRYGHSGGKVEPGRGLCAAIRRFAASVGFARTVHRVVHAPSIPLAESSPCLSRERAQERAEVLHEENQTHLVDGRRAESEA